MNKSEKKPGLEIAVVGINALLPGTPGRHGFWRDILAGRDCITEVPPSHWLIEDYYDPDPSAPDKTYCKKGGFLDPVKFDPLAFGIPPTTLPSTDTAQLLALIVARQVLDEACATQFQSIDKSRASIILGVASATELVVQLGSRLQRPHWIKALREEGLPESQVQRVADAIADTYVPWQESSFPGLLGNVVAGRIANRLDLGGSNFVTDAACASSLSAMQAGLNELRLGQSDLVITGGVDALNDILMYMCFSKTPAFSPTGDCRPFSDQADGTILGEGLAMVALRRLEEAEREGNRIYAVIRGIGSSSDGKATSVYAPKPDGQAEALKRAYQAAGYGPETIELVEAHGTGTVAGDAAEFEGLCSVFQPVASGRRQWCALGSVKSQIGHTKAAAGAAGFFKVVMAIHNKVLPPTAKVERPNPKLNLEDSPFYLNTTARPWIRGHDHPRRASVSSFGFGGSNFHVTVEEYRGAGELPQKSRALPAELYLLSADNTASLVEKARNSMLSLAGDLARVTQDAGRLFDVGKLARVAIVATSIENLAAQLADFTERGEGGVSGIHSGTGKNTEGQVAFMFPGQGSQYVGMGADLAMAFESTRRVWDSAAGLVEFTGDFLHDIVFPAPAFDTDTRDRQQFRLTEMVNAQPAIGAASLAQLAMLDSLGLKPDAVAGHSFGEVTALHAAGVLGPLDTLRVARRRGRLMTEAAAGTEGMMIALRLDREEAVEFLSKFSLDIDIANDNGPAQVVLSGPREEIEEAIRLCDAEGITAMRLPVATAFHSPIVAGSVQPFLGALSDIEFRSPEIPVFGCTDACPYPEQASKQRKRLAEQIASPVRFRDQVDALYESGVRLFIEVGPGATLTKLVGQCLDGLPHYAVAIDRKGSNGVESLLRAVAQFAALGLDLDYGSLWREAPPDAEENELPSNTVEIRGSNYGKPYPPAGGASELPQPNPELSDCPANADPAQAPVLPAPAPDAAIEAFHRQLSETHEVFQKSMTESHLAFLNMTERLLGGQPVDSLGSAQRPQPMAPPPRAYVPTPPAQELPAAPTAKPDIKPSAPEAPAAFSPRKPIATLVIDLVAEKTGYPAKMLNLDMELEADLGIDSIKQVEIMSGLREQIPDLDEIDPGQLTDLNTLGQIVVFAEKKLEQNCQSPSLVPVPAAGALSPQLRGPGKSISADNTHALGELLVSIVAEKTGYPAEMLNLDMELEADLGIDSIKQVEIFSAVREKMPDMPELDPAQLAELRTLDAILRSIQDAGSSSEGKINKDAPQPTQTKDHISASAAIRRFGIDVVPMPQSGFAMPGLHSGGKIGVSDDGNGVAEALVAALNEGGFEAEVLDKPAHALSGLILLGGLAADAGPKQSVSGIVGAISWAAAVAPQFRAHGGAFVTVQDTGGDFCHRTDSEDRAWSGGYPALVKTAKAEWPKAAVKAIDIDAHKRSVRETAQAIAMEVVHGGPEIEVGLSVANGRQTPVVKEIPPETSNSTPALHDGMVIVASAGGRGITAAALIELCRHHRLRLALFGRTAHDDATDQFPDSVDEASLVRGLAQQAAVEKRQVAPAQLVKEARSILAGRELQGNIRALQSLGAEVKYFAVDIRNQDALAGALDQIRRDWGAIAGIVHGAGVLADRKIEAKTSAQVARVAGTKVDGLVNLLQATADDPLKIICLFSSAAAVGGNAGQADYAMANEVLNKVALMEARRRPKCVVKSIAWGPWDGGMVDAALRALFKRRGIPLTPVLEGCEFLYRELHSGDPRVQVVAGAASLGVEDKRIGEITFTPRILGLLQDHVINGAPVLPVVLVLEWFHRFASAIRPGLTVSAIRDFRVLRGVALEPGMKDLPTLEIAAQGIATDKDLSLTISENDGQPRYTARVQMAIAGSVQAMPVDLSLAKLGPWPLKPEEAYEGKLFHGASFQVITALDGVSDVGGQGVLCGADAPPWSDESWLTGPAIIDGALQLALLWAIKETRRVFLPTYINLFRLFCPIPLGVNVTVRFESRLVDQEKTESRFILSTADGSIIGELEGVEMYRIGGQNEPSSELEPAFALGE